MCLNQALPKAQIRCFQPPKEECTECNPVDTAGFAQLQCNGEIHIIWFMTPDPSVRSTLQGFLERDHSSPNRNLQFKKLQSESFSYKVRFKAGISKDKTGGQTQNTSLCSCTCLCVRWGWRLNTWEGAVCLGMYMSKLATVLCHVWLSRWENSVLNDTMLLS